MYPDNRLFKEFLYLYIEMQKFLDSVKKTDDKIGIPMVLFMVNVINRELELNRALTKKELQNNKIIPHATFYRLLKVAINSGLLIEAEESYTFPYTVPPHLQVADTVHKKEIVVGV